MKKAVIEIYGWKPGMPTLTFYRYISKVSTKDLKWAHSKKEGLLDGEPFQIEVEKELVNEIMKTLNKMCALCRVIEPLD